MLEIKILDTTLRDGMQGAKMQLQISERIEIIKLLAELGIFYIEAGNPCSNPRDRIMFDRLKNMKFDKSRLVAFGMTPQTKNAAKNKSFEALLKADTPVVSIVCKACEQHVTQILGVGLEENIENIFNTVRFFQAYNKDVILDIEHFFDAYNSSKEYCMKVIRVAMEAGVHTLCMCDTVGRYFPEEIKNICLQLRDEFPDVDLGIHTHNDNGCAIANTMSAIQCGISHVQGTMLGVGERCGNADLSTIIPNIQLLLKKRCLHGDSRKISEISKRIAKIMGIRIEENKPFIGENAFTHKAGIHVNGQSKLAGIYENIDPQEVGNNSKYVASDLSGTTLIYEKTKDIIPGLEIKPEQVKAILAGIKELTATGFIFDYGITYDIFIRKYFNLFNNYFQFEKFILSEAYQGKNNFNMIIYIGEGYQKSIEIEFSGFTDIVMEIKESLMTFYSIADFYVFDSKIETVTNDINDKICYRGYIEFGNSKKKYKLMTVDDNYVGLLANMGSDSLNYYIGDL